MSIYQKLSAARTAFHDLKLEKTGHNKFAGYKYFELRDFLVPGLKCMADAGLCPVILFAPDRSEARMELHETDGEGVIVFTTPTAEANLKGCHPIQNLGAEQTYLRRYLWMAALEIVEHDAVDSAEPAAEPEPANERQMAQIRDYVEAGAVPEKTQEWLESLNWQLTREQAGRLLSKLQNAAKAEKKEAA